MVFVAKRVAVIGAGVSGLTSARHLKAAGLEVVVYERSSVSGGVWYVQLSSPSPAQSLTALRTYIERKPLEPKYPSLNPSEADFVANTNGNASAAEVGAPDRLNMEDIDLSHGPPG